MSAVYLSALPEDIFRKITLDAAKNENVAIIADGHVPFLASESSLSWTVPPRIFVGDLSGWLGFQPQTAVLKRENLLKCEPALSSLWRIGSGRFGDFVVIGNLQYKEGRLGRVSTGGG